MKKIIFFFALVYVSNNELFSQNISGEVEYEISSWECKYCRLKGKKKVAKSILKVSDYRYLPQLYFAALNEEGEFGCVKYEWNHCSLSTNVNEVHSIIEIDIPITEKKSFMNISKDKVQNISEISLTNLAVLSQKKINSEYTKWKKIFDEEQNQIFLKSKIEAEKAQANFNLDLEKLENLIQNQDLEKAALFYTELSLGHFDNDLLLSKKDIIQTGLNNLNAQIVNLNEVQLSKIVYSNKEFFKGLIDNNVNTYEIIFDPKGNGFVNDLPVNIRNNNLVFSKEVGKFKVYCTTKGTFLLTTEQIQNPNKLYLDTWVEPGIKICKSGSKYFKKTFLSASIFKNEIKVVNNEQVPHGKFYKVRHDLKLYKVNNNEIYREELLIKDSEGNLSKRLWVKIGRGTGFLASLSWLTLRIIEYSSVK